MFEESKPRINFSLIMALAVVAFVAAIASALVVRRKGQQRLNKVQAEHQATLENLHSVLSKCQAELALRPDPLPAKTNSLIIMPPFSAN